MGSVDGSNVTKTTLSSDPSGTAANNNIGPNNNEAWRVVGAGGSSGTAGAGNGWNLAALPCTQGAEFDVDTTGYHYIIFQYDWYTTNQGVRDLQALYTTDGSIWTPVGQIQVSGGGSILTTRSRLISTHSELRESKTIRILAYVWYRCLIRTSSDRQHTQSPRRHGLFGWCDRHVHRGRSCR